MAHNLVTLLAKSPSETLFNYRSKIESLTIDVGIIATKTYNSRRLDIKELIQHLPRLTEIRLCHYKDAAPYRQLDENLKWHYPIGLFDTLGIRRDETDSGQNSATVDDGRCSDPTTESTIRLKSWAWSSRMMGPDLRLASLRDIHLSPCFAGLRKLSFVNYQLPSLRATSLCDPEIVERDRIYIQHLAESIEVLVHLKHVIIESSTAVNENFLPLLPKSIQHLELINCWDVKSEDFAEYLVTHGRQLRYLTLDHNQSLSLGFLPVLGISCPNLKAIRMNLQYFNHHEFYKDSDPFYEFLLSADQVPSWPSSIEVIHLWNLRKWSAEAAETLFQSLVDNARHLPMLRELHIKAMLDIPFRQRCEIRDKWESLLRDVFLRRSEEPLPRQSLRPTPVNMNMKSPLLKQTRRQCSTLSPARRSNRLACQISGTSSRASSVGRDLRRFPRGRLSYTEPDTDEDLEELDLDESAMARENTAQLLSPHTKMHDSQEEATVPFVQGLCDVVNVRFDNQKPVERQLGMDDFLDSEANDASDEEWNGDVEFDDDDAW
jgi:hypothetical protein